MPTQSKAEIIRGIFAAYMANDRGAVEDALADDFHFTSPYDDEIDKATYFVRCWRNADWIERHELEKIFIEGDEAFVNTEFFTFEGDKIKRIEAFFGVTYQGGEFIRQKD